MVSYLIDHTVFLLKINTGKEESFVLLNVSIYGEDQKESVRFAERNLGLGDIKNTSIVQNYVVIVQDQIGVEK